MASNFPPQMVQKESSAYIDYFPVTAAQTFIAGALVFYDTSANTITECAADPTAILGIALAPASVGLDAAGSFYGGTKIPVQVLGPDTILFMASATTPAQSHVGDSYGVVKSTNWLVDTSETGAPCVTVIGISNSPQQEGFYVRLLATDAQMDSVAS
jgi:hypothetical protein